MQVPIPFLDEEVDLTDPASAGMTAVTVVIGFALLYVHQSLGQRLAGEIESILGLDNSGDGGIDIL